MSQIMEAYWGHPGAIGEDLEPGARPLPWHFRPVLTGEHAVLARPVLPPREPVGCLYFPPGPERGSRGP